MVYRKNLFEVRRNDLARIQSTSAGMTRVPGRVLVTGVGEILVDIKFPVWFSDRPYFSFAGELDTNFSVADGVFPTVSVVVVKWVNSNQSDGFVGYYSGAKLAVVTKGPSGQQMWIHWTAEGPAVNLPV